VEAVVIKSVEAALFVSGSVVAAIIEITQNSILDYW
jgi:hypothetical protein